MILSGVLRGRLRLARNQLWPRGRARRRPSGLIAILGVLLLAGFFFLGAGEIFGQLEAAGHGRTDAGAALALFVAVALAALLISDLHHAVAGLLLDSDVEFLLRTPVSRAGILFLKVLDSLPRSAGPTIVVALPAVIAFAMLHPLPWWGWLLLPVQLGALLALPLGLGVIAGLLLVRVVPGQRAREALALFSTLTLVVVWFANSFLVPRLAAQHGGSDPLRLLLEPPSWAAAASPPHWVAGAVVAAANGDVLAALPPTVALVVAGVLSLLLAAWAARASLEEAMARALRVSKTSRVLRGSGQPAAGWQALLLKDARLFLREWPVLADVLAAALLWTVLPLLAAPIRQGPPLFTARAMLIALAVALGYEVGSRVVPFERTALAWTRLAPVTPRRWNGAKLAGAALVSVPLLLVAALAIGLVLRLDRAEWALALSAGLSALAVALSLGIWTGWRFGDRAWTHPRAMLTLAGRLVATVFLLLQGAMWLSALAIADAMSATLPRGISWWGPPLLAALITPLLLAAADARMRRFEFQGA
jgi:hypothetical protein